MSIEQILLLVGVVVALFTLCWFAMVLFWLIGRDGDR